ncbi:MAG: FtsX-like permease family protein [Acidimicrobiales bacterium]
MFRLTIKEIAARKLRLVSTAVAVVLGVSFLTGTLVLTDTVTKTFDSLLADANAGTDAYVRGESPLDLSFGEARPRIDTALVDRLRAVDGVAEVGVRVTGYAQILDKKGKAVGSVDSGVMGMNWSPVDALNPFRLTKGHAPTNGDEIVIDKHSADTAGFAPGDRTTVLTQGAPRDFTIVGVAKFGKADSPGGTAMVLFDDVTAQALLAEPGHVDGASFIADRGVTPASLVADLAPLITDGVEVITGAQLTKEDQQAVHDNINEVSTFMLVFAGVAMFVGAFIINNTFSIIVSQRTKEMAMLRAIGASGRQVKRAVLTEATIVGLLASTLGVVAGIGVAKGLEVLLGTVGLEIPDGPTIIQTRTIVISMVIGVVVTVVSAAMPARRAAKVPPIAAMRDVASDRSAASKRRTAAGLAIVGLGVASLLGGLSATDVKLVGLGAVGVFIGISVLGPVLARPFGSVVGYPIAKARGMSGRLARQNAMRNPKRTARTAASLMIGVGLVAFITIFAASVKTSVAGSLDTDYRGTHIVESGAYDSSSGLSPEFAAAVKAAPGVRIVAEERLTHVEIDGVSEESFQAFDTNTIGQLFDLGDVEGDITQLGADGIAVKVDKNSATRPHLGDTRQVTFTTGVKTFVVRATYDNGSEWVGDHFVGLDAFGGNVPAQLDARVYVATDDATALEAAAGPYPTADVMDKDEFMKSQNAQIDTMLTLIYAMLALAVLIALLGIANTLALSIHERTRELGLLRAVGMSRAQVRSSVRWESVVIALFGTVLGLGIGAFFGWAMMKALADEGLDTLTIPVGQLVVVTAIAALAGIGAAVMPARRASRIDVLKAVGSS